MEKKQQYVTRVTQAQKALIVGTCAKHDCNEAEALDILLAKQGEIKEVIKEVEKPLSDNQYIVTVNAEEIGIDFDFIFSSENNQNILQKHNFKTPADLVQLCIHKYLKQTIYNLK